MRLEHGLFFFCPLRRPEDQLLGAGNQRPQRIVNLQISQSVEAFIKLIGLPDRSSGIHGDRLRQSCLIHGRIGKRPSKPAPCIHLCGFLHKIAAGVDKSGGPGMDHLHRRCLCAQPHFLRRQRTLIRQHDPGPDHGHLVQHPPPQKLLPGMHMAVHQSRHIDAAASVQLFLPLIAFFQFRSRADRFNFPITDQDTFPLCQFKCFIQIITVSD